MTIKTKLKFSQRIRKCVFWKSKILSSFSFIFMAPWKQKPNWNPFPQSLYCPPFETEVFRRPTRELTNRAWNKTLQGQWDFQQSTLALIIKMDSTLYKSQWRSNFAVTSLCEPKLIFVHAALLRIPKECKYRMSGVTRKWIAPFVGKVLS